MWHVCDGCVSVWEKASEREWERKREIERECVELGHLSGVGFSITWWVLGIPLGFCDLAAALLMQPFYWPKRDPAFLFNIRVPSCIWCVLCCRGLHGYSPAATLERNNAAAPDCPWSESGSQNRPSMHHQSCFLTIESLLKAVPSLCQSAVWWQPSVTVCDASFFVISEEILDWVDFVSSSLKNED